MPSKSLKAQIWPGCAFLGIGRPTSRIRPDADVGSSRSASTREDELPGSGTEGAGAHSTAPPVRLVGLEERATRDTEGARRAGVLCGPPLEGRALGSVLEGPEGLKRCALDLQDLVLSDLDLFVPSVNCPYGRARRT